MLEECAPGYETRQTVHFHVVSYKDKTFSTLPLGKHGARRNPEIEAGYARALARQLEIVDCAKKQLPQIY